MESQDSLIADIYEAAAIPELWPELLGKLSALVEGAGGLLFTTSPDHTRWTASDEIRPMLEDFVNDGWAALNQRPRRIAELNYAGFIHEPDVFTLEELDRDPVYTEFFRKRGLGWAAGTLISVPNGDSVIFSFERAYAKGPYERATIDWFDRLRPHLARAALLSTRLGLARVRAMTDALASVGLPAAVLRNGGGLLAANAAFEKLIPTTIQDRSPRIALADANADELLFTAISARPAPANRKVTTSIPMPATDDRPPLIFHLVPIEGNARDIFSSARSLLIVTPVDRVAVPSATVLQGLFDLTPAEARVAHHIVGAETIEAAAEAIGVSRETIRSQLKSILAKTGVSRQQELISLLGGKTLPLGK